MKETLMPIRTFGPSEITKLKTLMSEGIQVTGEIEALREGLKDTVKAISEEMDMKPAVLNKAIRIAYKNEFANVQDSFNAVEEILQATGRDV